MAVTSSACPKLLAATPFDCRSDSSGGTDQPSRGRFSARFRSMRNGTGSFLGGGGGDISSMIFRFPPNFARQLSTKARRNCSNIGVAQIVAASWSDNPAAATSVVPAAYEAVVVDGVNNSSCSNANSAQLQDLTSVSSFLSSDGSIAVHAGERLGRRIVTDAITTPVVNASAYFFKNTAELIDFKEKRHASFEYGRYGNPTDPRSDGSIAVHAGERLGRRIVTDSITTPVWNTSAYFFKNTAELIDFKEKRHASFEYGRYGNPTTVVLEEKISALEGAESTLVLASGMCASTVLLMALVPAGGHIVTTTDCYRKTRIFIETFLPKMGITATVIDPADMEALQSALENNKVSLFFTESPTNPFLRCVDIKLVSELCHRKGALVCIDGTFATPLNQKALTLGADLIVHSATKFIGGHNDVLAGCVSGSMKLVSEVRNLHHVLGGTLNPNAAYLIIRGMKTLHLRVQQQNSTAMRMAEVLEAHPKVRHVYYPGLPSHPEHDIAKQQMTGYGGVVSFEVDGDLNTTIKFVDALKIPYIAPSFGGCECIVDQPAIMSYWDLPQADREEKYGIRDNLVRFSFGVEDFDDLKADILQALETI